MDTKKLALVLAFSLIFAGIGNIADAATVDTRYLVKSNSTFWKNSLGVRHQFDGGFTTELSDIQIRMAKLFGVKLEPVKKLYVLDETAKEVEVLAPKTKRPSIDPTPTDQIPWGVEYLYNDLLLSKTDGGKGVNIAVLDTGIFKDHPDLFSRVAICKDFTGPRGVINDKCEDKNGHGTHVAGIIAADGGPEGKGIYGVAPEADLFVYRVCGNDGACWADDIAAAIKASANDGANIINISLGGDTDPQFIADAVDYASQRNVLVIAAAGNDGPFDGTIDYPAAYLQVVAVAAMDIGYDIPDWSSRGDNSNTALGVKNEHDMELAAPGVNIESTWKDGGYVILSGTSMAAPHITGLAAKQWANVENPAQYVRSVIKSLTIDIGSQGEDSASGYGFPRL